MGFNLEVLVMAGLQGIVAIKGEIIIIWDFNHLSVVEETVQTKEQKY